MSGNNLLVANAGSDTVREYDATTGAVINANFITGLNAPTALAVAPTSTPTPPVAKDFDADGFAGLAWENTSSGQRCLWFLKNGVLSTSVSLPALPSRGTSQVWATSTGTALLTSLCRISAPVSVPSGSSKTVSSPPVSAYPTCLCRGTSRGWVTSTGTALLTLFGRTPALVNVPSGLQKRCPFQ